MKYRPLWPERRQTARRLLLVMALSVVACSAEKEEQQELLPGFTASTPGKSEESTVSLDPVAVETVRDISNSYLDSIGSQFEELQQQLAELQRRTDVFLDGPNEELLIALREQWQQSYLGFERATIHRQFMALVLPEREADALATYLYRLNQWPILPGYVDSLANYPDTGIISDVDLQISADILRQQHGLFAREEATLGFHVMEFLIWGEQLGTPREAALFDPVRELSAGQRDAGFTVEQLPNNRRRRYLTLSTDLLLADHQSIVDMWDDYALPVRLKLRELSAEQLLTLLLESSTATLTDGLLDNALYPILNGDYSQAQPAAFADINDSAVIALLSGVEGLLLELRSRQGRTLDQILASMSPDFERSFYSSLDGSKACLVRLYAGLEQPQSFATELQVVECINLLTNLLGQIDQLKLGLGMLAGNQ